MYPEPMPILRVNGAFRGIPISDRKSEISLRYRPASLRTGAIISISTLAAILLVGVISLWKSRRAN